MTVIDTAGFTAEWDAWHGRRERDLAAPHGWLSVTGLHWLDTEPADHPGLPGRWHAEGDGTVVLTPGAETPTVAGAPAGSGATVRITPDPSGAPVVVTFAGRDLRAEVLVRGGAPAVRVRDPQAPARAAFTGVPAYPPAPGWVVTARLDRFAEPRPVTTGAVVDGLTHTRTAIGRARFGFAGEEHALLVFGLPDGGAYVQFRDATSGVTTSGNSRELTAARPTGDGVLVLDFNRAVNLPCAFTDHATCPLAPAENTLPFPVEAGERDPAR